MNELLIAIQMYVRNCDIELPANKMTTATGTFTLDNPLYVPNNNPPKKYWIDADNEVRDAEKELATAKKHLACKHATQKLLDMANRANATAKGAE